jgi:predicted polyphosphate/ATP-dependent NAD kinase
MLKREVDLLLFAGGDGTARDVYSAVRDRLPVLGIPAGVKIHSAAFATSPRSAGDLAASFLQGDTTELREAEVLDLDEEAVREGVVSAELYGYVRIPFQNRLIQGLKAPSSPEDQAAMESIAADIVDRMQEDQLYILGPGTTTRAITAELDLDKTLIGVDVVRNKELIAQDVNESELLALLDRYEGQAHIVVTPIGGQGYIFGRGNQQISYRVIEKVGTGHVDAIIVVSTPDKMYSLDRRPLLADTGSREVDEELAGYVKVITGYKESMMYKVAYA